jgi:hypothetical protein
MMVVETQIRQRSKRLSMLTLANTSPCQKLNAQQQPSVCGAPRKLRP